jgi:hypothetical protein
VNPATSSLGLGALEDEGADSPDHPPWRRPSGFGDVQRSSKRVVEHVAQHISGYGSAMSIGEAHLEWSVRLGNSSLCAESASVAKRHRYDES